MTTRFWLIRHGETEDWARHRCYGSLDVGLSPAGRAQMADAARFLKAERIKSIVTSPLRRAAESARIVAAECQCPCGVNPAFQEIDFGDFEGLTYDEIATRYPDVYRCWMETPAEVKFPNGEDFKMLRSRVLDAFHELAAARPGGTIAVVSHSGVIRALIAWALQIPDNCLFRIGQDFGALNLLVLNDAIPAVQLMNWKCVPA